MNTITKKLYLFLILTALCIANVRVASAQSSNGYFGPYFRHTVTAANSFGNTSSLSDTSVNNNSSALIFMSSCFNPNSVYNNFIDAVWYSGSYWNIYNESTSSAVPLNSTFNIIKPTVNSHAFVHSSTGGAGVSVIHDVYTDSKPDALLFVTPNISASPVANNKVTGVYYNGTYWTIYNGDITTIPADATFNVLVVDSANENAFIHTTTAANVVDNKSYIDNSFLNNNPNACILTTERSLLFVNNHITGVMYDAFFQKWAIYNQDSSAMPVGTPFNVLIANNIHDGITELNDASLKQLVFPSIAADIVNVRFDLDQSGLTAINLLSMQGTRVKCITEKNLAIGSYEYSSSVKELTPGNYFIEIRSGSKVSRQQFIVSK